MTFAKKVEKIRELAADPRTYNTELSTKTCVQIAIASDKILNIYGVSGRLWMIQKAANGYKWATSDHLFDHWEGCNTQFSE